jgi:2-haloacid dehalogenase
LFSRRLSPPLGVNYLTIITFFIQDALEVITELHKKFNLYIVTNGVTATQIRRLSESGIDRYMKKIFVSEETGFQKPMKEYFDYCFLRL